MASAAEQLAANINFGAFGKAKELQQRILFTLGALIAYRLGTYIPMPGIDAGSLAAMMQKTQGGILGMFNAFGGGAFGRMAIFALNIMPYITASIIIQVLTDRLADARRAQEGGRVRAQEDQPIHPLRHGLIAALQAFVIAKGLEGAGFDRAEPGSAVRAHDRRHADRRHACF